MFLLLSLIYVIGWFSNDCRKTNTKVIASMKFMTVANSVMNQLEFPTISHNLFKAQEKSQVQGVIDFGFASYWLKTWHRIFEPITHVITFDSYLKTAFNLQVLKV